MTDLVRVKINGFEKNVGATFAEIKELDVLDEPTHRTDGQPRAMTRSGGRRVKKQTTVKAEAAKKAAKSSEGKASAES